MAGVHAPFLADSMIRFDSPLIVNEPVAEKTYRLRIAAPGFAERFRPGQFVMIRLTGVHAPLIGRALAVYNVISGDDGPGDDGNGDQIELVYLVKGALTVPLSQSPVGTMVSVWGPLGNGFSDAPCDRLIMAVGGIGQTPMLTVARDALGRDWAKSAELIYGARTASYLAGIDDFLTAGLTLRLCTDDGSRGEHARVPDVLANRLAELQQSEPGVSIRVLTCGPEIMMQKVAEICGARGVACEVSMETPMACGIGICFSCVAKVWQDDGTWDYKRTCVEGPIFDARRMCWD